MPELPEVETTVKGLREKVLNRTFVDIWTDWEKTFKNPKSFKDFKKELIGKKILRVWRRAKNIIFELSDGYSLLVHMKMTGHLMVGKWRLEKGIWQPEEAGPLEEKINLFLHAMLMLDNGQILALSDLRKFAKIELWKTEELLHSPEFENIGPEPLEESFTLEVFKKTLAGKRGKVKQVIMVPEVIAGIGNIYASEALWWAKIHPQKDVSNLDGKELKLLYKAIRKVLEAGIRLGGGSFSDYRNVDGKKGSFEGDNRVYQREDQPCSRCRTPIKRIMFGGRSAFYCPVCQTLI
ncbi:bifunctional DNA-formamidopyrimidine glycosylase/DNA-(apurinic or apyrimidinic site) lyase [Candidatus Parcubacteria bacterium]|nr:bifunctional DNA-formamidopyrimidine glycosylase/DNA-(apurinic or apyrimidinic site) lyase [Candidatus Parcubacteria bacterium]